MDKYAIDEEWWRWHNLHPVLLRVTVCWPQGHHWPRAKFGGSILCRRCHKYLGEWR